MTYAARDETTLPKLPAQVRWVVLVDKRQLAVLLLDIRAGQHTLTAADPLPADLRDALAQISGADLRTK